MQTHTDKQRRANIDKHTRIHWQTLPHTLVHSLLCSPSHLPSSFRPLSSAFNLIILHLKLNNCRIVFHCSLTKAHTMNTDCRRYTSPLPPAPPSLLATVVLFNILRFGLYFVTFRFSSLRFGFTSLFAQRKPNQRGDSKDTKASPCCPPPPTPRLLLLLLLLRATQYSAQVPCPLWFIWDSRLGDPCALTSTLPSRASLLFLSLSRPLNSQ